MGGADASAKDPMKGTSMQTENYKARTHAVRRNARAQLKELRQARRSQRAEAQSAGLEEAPAEAAAPPVTDEELVGPTAGADLVPEQPTTTQDIVEETPTLPEDSFVLDTAEDATPEQPDLAIVEELVKEAPAVEAFDDVVDAIEADAEQSVPEELPTPDSADLERLPGAGPGLIWMLNECGIYSLADLAAQDPGALAQKLGIVGQILDVGHWVRLAQTDVAA